MANAKLPRGHSCERRCSKAHVDNLGTAPIGSLKYRMFEGVPYISVYRIWQLFRFLSLPRHEQRIAEWTMKILKEHHHPNE